MQRIVAERYPLEDWNIYAAQASDGDNYSGDSETCTRLLRDELLPLCQYFAYVEVVDEREAGMFRSEANASALWRDYKAVADGHANFAMRRVFSKADIFPVFTSCSPRRARRPEVRMSTAASQRPASRLLYETGEWSFDTLKRTYDAIEEIAVGEMGLDPYPNQIEMISAEQMLDAYSSIGMPVFYSHWSFGKRFVRDEKLYRKGYTGLAYEIVINSNPCISYIMEENTMTMQALVMAHAAFGHNHFFKNNYLFKEGTDAEGILDYLSFAKAYVSRCEEQHGIAAVERVLDGAHALMDQGVNRYGRRARPSLAEEKKRADARRAHHQSTFNDLWRTVPTKVKPAATEQETDAAFHRLGLPEENLLYFIEKFSPRLQDWNASSCASCASSPSTSTRRSRPRS